MKQKGKVSQCPVWLELSFLLNTLSVVAWTATCCTASVIEHIKNTCFWVKINKTLDCAKGMTQKMLTVMMSTTLLSIHTKYLAQSLCKKSDFFYKVEPSLCIKMMRTEVVHMNLL
jgi:hypothetical protein